MNNFYKITLNNRSVISHLVDPTFGLSYEIGKTTMPHIGKIFVFDTVEHAYLFTRKFYFGSDFQLFYGTGTNPEYIKLMAFNPLAEECTKFWKLRKNKKRLDKMNIDIVPNGTVVVDSFTPTKMYTMGEIEKTKEIKEFWHNVFTKGELPNKKNK